jgi:HEAT repeat protein
MTGGVLLCLFLAPDPPGLVEQLRSIDAATRLRAVQQVERLGAEGAPDEAYLAPLAGLLRDTDLQTRGLAALALWRHVPACKGQVPEGVIAPLLLALRDPNEHVAGYCDMALSVIGPYALPQLWEAVTGDQPREQRLAALEGGRRLMVFPDCQEGVDALYWTLLADRDAVVRDRARALLKLGRSDYLLPPPRDRGFLLVALYTEDDNLRTLALSLVDESMFPALLVPLADPDHPARNGAIRALGRLLEQGHEPPPELTPSLLRATEIPGAVDHTAARRTLTVIARDQGPPDSATIATVDNFLDPKTNSNTAYRYFAASKTSAHVARVLEDRLLASDPTIQANACWALRVIYSHGRRPSPKGLTNLTVPLLSSNRQASCEAAATLAGGLQPNLKVPPTVLEALSVAILRDDLRLRSACACALAGCGLQAEDLLIDLLQHPDSEVRRFAAKAVQAMVACHGIAPRRTEPALKTLLWTFNSDQSRAASAALDALKSRPRGGVP